MGGIFKPKTPSVDKPDMSAKAAEAARREEELERRRKSRHRTQLTDQLNMGGSSIGKTTLGQ